MRVEVIASTELPMNVVSLAAGMSYGKDNVSTRRVYNCFEAGHMSVFEHASITFRISGISRACSHQLVRHRLASFVQESQRYCKIDTNSRDWYVKPNAFCAGEDDPVLTMEKDEFFYGCMMDAARNYQDALKAGIKPEDARFLLPEATKTNIVMTCNVRELWHFMTLRMAKDAQWEIRKLANMMFDAACGHSAQWAEIMAMWAIDHVNGEA